MSQPEPTHYPALHATIHRCWLPEASRIKLDKVPPSCWPTLNGQNRPYWLHSS